MTFPKTSFGALQPLRIRSKVLSTKTGADVPFGIPTHTQQARSRTATMRTWLLTATTAFEKDIELMKGIGIKAYRFSVAWPRIFPSGRGDPNPKGMEFYLRLVDELLKAGIEPVCTLYHWDLPETLQDRGGWQSRDTAQAFADYSAFVVKRLSPAVKKFIHNERDALFHRSLVRIRPPSSRAHTF